MFFCLWQPVLSPLEGTKMTVNNLHPRVTEEDIVVSTVAGQNFKSQATSVSRVPKSTARLADSLRGLTGLSIELYQG